MQELMHHHLHVVLQLRPEVANDQFGHRRPERALLKEEGERGAEEARLAELRERFGVGKEDVDEEVRVHRCMARAQSVTQSASEAGETGMRPLVVDSSLVVDGSHRVGSHGRRRQHIAVAPVKFGKPARDAAACGCGVDRGIGIRVLAN